MRTVAPVLQVERVLLTFTILLFLCTGAHAAALTPDEAARHVGERGTVCGIVQSTNYASQARSQPTFLNFGKAYPNQVFTAVIFGNDRPKFGTPETSLRGTSVCVTGDIRSYRGKSEIIVHDPAQITR